MVSLEHSELNLSMTYINAPTDKKKIEQPGFQTISSHGIESAG